MYFPVTNLWENFYLCNKVLPRLSHSIFPERHFTFKFYQKKKCYRITQDGNKAGEKKRVCLGQRLQMEIHVSAVGVPEHEVEDNIQIPQNTFRWCKMRFGTISKTERRTIRAGFYLKVSKCWFSVSCGWELKENMDWTMIVNSQSYGVWTAVLEMDYNSSPKVENKDKNLNWLGRCFGTSF